MENIRNFYLKFFSFLEVNFSIYLNRSVFVMQKLFLFELRDIQQLKIFKATIACSHC